MGKSFYLEIATPEKIFFAGNVISVTTETTSGRLTIMADHIPMICVLGVGELCMTIMEEYREQCIAFHSNGFMEVTRDFTVILVQACEWPWEINKSRAENDAATALKRYNAATPEKIREQASAKNALKRAQTRLRIKNKFENGNYKKIT